MWLEKAMKREGDWKERYRAKVAKHSYKSGRAKLNVRVHRQAAVVSDKYEVRFVKYQTTPHELRDYATVSPWASRSFNNPSP